MFAIGVTILPYATWRIAQGRFCLVSAEGLRPNADPRSVSVWAYPAIGNAIRLRVHGQPHLLVV